MLRGPLRGERFDGPHARPHRGYVPRGAGAATAGPRVIELTLQMVRNLAPVRQAKQLVVGHLARATPYRTFVCHSYPPTFL